MAINTTNIGTYTNQITINGETGVANITAALDAAIVAGGFWSQWDVSNPYYRVYRALNIDGISYKYAAVSMDPWKMRLWLSSWESWDATAHTGTNESFTTYGGYWSGFTFYNCDIVVFAGPRHLGIQTYTRNINNPSNSFVVETSREHAQDTAAAGYPCWGYLAPQALTQPTPYGSGTTNSALFSMPRARTGQIGRAAAQACSISTPFHRVSSGNNQLAGYGNVFPTQGLAAALNQVTNPWDATTSYTYTLRIEHGQTGYQGRMSAFKGAKIAGAALLNRVTVPIDANQFYSAPGTPTEHWTIPLNLEKSTLLTPIVYANTQVPQDLVWNGNTLFYANATGLYRMDIGTQIITTVLTQSGNKVSMCFDGRYIWMIDTTNLKIIKWDTTNDTITTSASAITGSSAQRMCYDGSFLWTLDNNPTASALIVRKIDPTTLMQVSSIQTAAISTTVRGVDIACDVFGTIGFIVTDGGAPINTRVHKITAGTITGSAAMVNAVTSSSSGNISWTGSPRSFDSIILGMGYTMLGGIFDLTSNAPTSVMYNPGGATTSVGQSSGYTAYVSVPRHGRSIFYATSSANQITHHDMDASNALDLGVVVNQTTSQLVMHLGTHLVSWSNTGQIALTPLNAGATSTGTQLLLPK